MQRHRLGDRRARTSPADEEPPRIRVEPGRILDGLTLKRQGLRLPGAAVLLCPWIDLAAAGRSCRPHDGVPVP